MIVKKQKSLLEIRAKEKAASRAADVARIKAGVSPSQIQRENDAFRGRFRKGINISNLAEALEH
jgi:hypothetical protein